MRSEYYFLSIKSQFFYLLIGILIMWFISWRVSPSWLVRIARPLVLAALVISLLPYCPYVGGNINSAFRWIKIPFTEIKVNPLEFLKVFVMLDLVSQLTKVARTIDRTTIIPNFFKCFSKSDREKIAKIIKTKTWPIFWPTLVAMLITSLSNFSTTAILFIMTLIILYIAGAKNSDLLKLFVYAVLLGTVYIWVSYSLGFGRGATVVSRLKSMVDMPVQAAVADNSGTIDFHSAAGIEDSSGLNGDFTFRSSDSKANEFQEQKEIAKATIASGGISGKGPGNSTFRAKLPHATSDCVFAFIVEEYGLLGGIAVILIYLWVLYRGCVIAMRSKYFSFYLLSMAISAHIFLTAMINVIVSVGLFVTGQTLPFIGSGGSSIVANSIAFGILLGISACPSRLKEQETNSDDEYTTENREELQ